MLQKMKNPCAEIVLSHPRSAILGNEKFGYQKKKPIEKWRWSNIDGVKIPLGKMKRTHVQNCLNWCIKRSTRPQTDMKDGHTYQEWITAFTVRLFDPMCE